MADSCDALRVIDARLANLKSEHDSLSASARSIRSVMNMLVDVRRSITGEQFPTPVPGKKPANAVRELLLSKHPEGLPKRVIVDSLVREIETKSRDPRRLLFNTILNLEKRGSVRVDDIDGEPTVFLA